MCIEQSENSIYSIYPGVALLSCMQCSQTLPRMKFLTYSLLFPDLMANIPYQFCMELCEIFLLAENISKYWIQEDIFFFLTIWLCLWSNIPLFVFELSYIFHIFENMKFPTFSWLFDPFPNPLWLCKPIPYLFKAFKFFNLIPDFFKIFPPCGNPVDVTHEYPWRTIVFVHPYIQGYVYNYLYYMVRAE